MKIGLQVYSKERVCIKYFESIYVLYVCAQINRSTDATVRRGKSHARMNGHWRIILLFARTACWAGNNNSVKNPSSWCDFNNTPRFHYYVLFFFGLRYRLWVSIGPSLIRLRRCVLEWANLTPDWPRRNEACAVHAVKIGFATALASSPYINIYMYIHFYAVGSSHEANESRVIR